MRLYELNHDGGYIGRAIRDYREQEAARTGLHVSTIIDRMVRAIDPKAYTSEFTEQQKHGYQEVGNVVEDFLAHWLRRRIGGWTKPEPRTHRGITGSPDGWTQRTRALHEIKGCWKSEKLFNAVIGAGTRRLDLFDLVRENLKLYSYVLQLLTYAEIWNADRGYLHILFINGDYKPPAPNPRTFTVVWTPRERRENFDRMVQFAIDTGLLDRRDDRKRRPPVIEGRVLWSAQKFKDRPRLHA